MLLNEFLKADKTVQELKKEIAALTARVQEQDSKIQKVRAQLQMSEPAPQVVHNR
jgi:DNA-binding protein H-NS